ncbi:MAG TPA: hypothetical protein PKA80_10595 [Ignavibacteriaceae bacterium]|nr:hypothetical protein [Ignavibacteriaceae bacterium]
MVLISPGIYVGSEINSNSPSKKPTMAKQYNLPRPDVGKLDMNWNVE